MIFQLLILEKLEKKVCSRQKEAARLGLLANKSLIKAFEIEGANQPMQAIKANQQRFQLERLL